MENKIEIIDKKCVNSKCTARFLATESQDYCQCSFGDCKIKVSITYNGHPPYTYILTGEEYETAKGRLEY